MINKLCPHCEAHLQNWKEMMGETHYCYGKDGIYCPYCGGLQHPTGKGGQEAKCLSCGYPYILPSGYRGKL